MGTPRVDSTEISGRSASQRRFHCRPFPAAMTTHSPQAKHTRPYHTHDLHSACLTGRDVDARIYLADEEEMAALEPPSSQKKSSRSALSPPVSDNATAAMAAPTASVTADYQSITRAAATARSLEHARALAAAHPDGALRISPEMWAGSPTHSKARYVSTYMQMACQSHRTFGLAKRSGCLFCVCSATAPTAMKTVATAEGGGYHTPKPSPKARYTHAHTFVRISRHVCTVCMASYHCVHARAVTAIVRIAHRRLSTYHPSHALPAATAHVRHAPERVDCVDRRQKQLTPPPVPAAVVSEVAATRNRPAQVRITPQTHFQPWNTASCNHWCTSLLSLQGVVCALCSGSHACVSEAVTGTAGAEGQADCCRPPTGKLTAPPLCMARTAWYCLWRTVQRASQCAALRNVRIIYVLSTV
jgi:hypothetical protein